MNPASTTTVLTASSNPALAGAPVTFTATVSFNLPGEGIPGGLVTFKDGAATIGSGTIGVNFGEAASMITSSLSAGPHSITAVYQGDGNCLGSSSSLTETINSKGTSVAITSSMNPAPLGQQVQFTAVVTASGGATPQGSLQWSVDGSPVATLALASAFTPTLSAGNHTVTATYMSSNGLPSSTSPPLAETITVPVTVALSVAGAQITVDGAPITSSATFQWLLNSSHILAASTSPQLATANTQWVFSTWSGVPAAQQSAPTQTITVPAAAAAFIANFTMQSLVTVNVNPALCGTVSGGGFYNNGSTATITATANPDCTFAGFSGVVVTASNPMAAAVNGPLTIVANFTPLAPAMAIAFTGARTDGSVPGTRNVPVTLTNVGHGPALNAEITAITAITVLSGSGAVSLVGALPGPLGSALAPGGSASESLVFTWPASATRVSFTFRLNATDIAGNSYPVTQTVTVFR